MNIRYVGHILKVHMWIAVVICFQIARLAAREGYISIREYNLAVNRIVMEHSGVPEFVHAELVSGMFQRGHDGRCCKAQQKTDALDLVRKYHDGKVVVLSVADLHSLRSEKDRLLRCVREIFGDIGVKKMVVVFNGDVAPRAAIGYVKTDQDEGRTVFLIDEFRALLTELKGLFLDKHVDGHIIVNIGNHDVQSFEYFVQMLEICHEMNVPVHSHIPQAFDSD
ncbi:MAG: hypothetical protein LBR89_03630, partial [Holosporales bacterium]|nr:hypothetical protein [Holosporales bacterium]